MKPLYRELQVRGIDEEARTATFVAATEAPVMMWGTAEVLRMKGLDKKALRTGVPLLDSHDRSSIGAVIGRCALAIEGRQLVATNTYATTARAEEAWQLVKGGFVRAMSIGYFVDGSRVKRIEAGQVDGKGEDAVQGPASIVNGWSVFEGSNVAIGADADAVRRSFYDSLTSNQEVPMKLSDIVDTGAPAGEPAVRSITTTITTPEPKPPAAEIPEERALRVRAAIDAQIRGMAPSHLRHVADACVLEGLDVEASRKRMLEAQAASAKPLGTPEPAPVQTKAEERGAATLTPETVLRALTGLRS